MHHRPDRFDRAEPRGDRLTEAGLVDRIGWRLSQRVEAPISPGSIDQRIEPVALALRGGDRRLQLLCEHRVAGDCPVLNRFGERQIPDLVPSTPALECLQPTHGIGRDHLGRTIYRAISRSRLGGLIIRCNSRSRRSLPSRSRIDRIRTCLPVADLGGSRIFRRLCAALLAGLWLIHAVTATPHQQESENNHHDDRGRPDPEKERLPIGFRSACLCPAWTQERCKPFLRNVNETRISLDDCPGTRRLDGLLDRLLDIAIDRKGNVRDIRHRLGRRLQARERRGP